MNKSEKILIVGHDDIIEKSLFGYLTASGYSDIFTSSRLSLDVFSQNAVLRFFKKENPQYIFLASTRSGGIVANQKYPAEFIYSNLESQNNIIHAAYKFGVKKLIFFAGSCVYPRKCSQPIKEESLLTGSLEPTSEAYSIAKIAGIKLCQAYRKQYGLNAIIAVPATVYGLDSDTDIETAHVMGALIGKFARAVVKKEKKVVVWGTGKPRREFIFTDDFARAAIFLMGKYNSAEIINVGYGSDVSIKELVAIIARISGFNGEIIFDKTKPDGAMQKLLDHSRIAKLGWKAKVSLEEGIQKTYKCFIKNYMENQR